MARTLKRIALVHQKYVAFTHRLTMGVCDYATPDRGYIVREFETGIESEELPRSFDAWKPDAVVCNLNSDSSTFDHLLADGRPVVNTSRDESQPGRGVVLSSATEQFDEIINHFQSLRLGHVGQFHVDETVATRQMTSLFKEYAAIQGLEHSTFTALSDPSRVYKPQELQTVEPILSEWLLSLPKPVGIFTQQFFAAPYLCKACELLGLRVPDDVAIVGVDSFDVALKSNPTVTSLVVPAELIGYEAAKLVTEMLDGKPAPEEAVEVYGVDMIVRGSTSKKKPEGCNIKMASEFIGKHAHLGISVGDILSHTQGISRNTFEKRFYQATQMKPVEAIRQQKMTCARHLLADSKISITSIANICGYCDDLYFRKVFKSIEGITPREYRKKMLARG